MKKLYILFAVFLAFSLTSCEDWLTVEPKDMITVDKALQEKEGYDAALSGIYQLLESVYSPSGFFKGSGVDVMANIYYQPGSNFSPYLTAAFNHEYDDTNFDSSSGAAFLSVYQALANINVILNELEETTVLSDEEKAYYLGECKALRALLQFDLWRVYGPTPTAALSTNEGVLPYAVEMTHDLMTYSNFNEYFTLLQADLDAARNLLADVDPIVKYSNDELNGNSEIEEYGTDLSFYYRQNRMNYYAVLGLSARVELWLGNNEEAYAYAKEVVDAVNTDGSKKFTLGNSSNVANGDYAFSTEHLFGVSTLGYDDDIYNAYEAYCVNSSYTLEYSVYPNYATDIRYQSLFATLTNNALVYNARVSLKYSNMSETDAGMKFIPVIRLSEMYLILVETAPSLADAQMYYNSFVNTRFDVGEELTSENRQQAVLNQYLREFWAEGQIFFTYKRLSLTTLPLSYASMGEDQYRVNLPTGETNSSL